MNWKEFLKPTIGKIVLDLIIFLLLIFIPILPSKNCSIMNPERCEYSFSSLFSHFKASVPLWQQVNLILLCLGLFVILYFIICFWYKVKRK
ncbi:MAG: hypothetical protein J7K26_03170 [Candidatus Aenigmarchaeota archaeon]|nr:hypothetical protein [Candidatus Aenigmarchaeota archaeon]